VKVKRPVPQHDRILAVRNEAEESSPIIDDSAEDQKDRPIMGRVIDVGPGKLLEGGVRFPISVKVGDEILFGKFAGTDVKVDDTEYLILREDEILATIEEIEVNVDDELDDQDEDVKKDEETPPVEVTGE
jgi:chaperonin GroES